MLQNEIFCEPMGYFRKSSDFLQIEGTRQGKNVFPAFLTMWGLFHNFPDKIKVTVWPLSEIKESNFKHQGINSTPFKN